jgi:drug/metabolite transporter (DMT)-like permease
VTDTLSSPPATAGALDAPAVVSSGASVRPGAPSPWRVWAALWVVYIVWGSTYLAIRVMVETIPPLLGASVRFLIAGGAMLAFLAARRGWAAVRPGRRELLGALAVGALLPGANAVVSVAEQDVPSSIAALLIASVPLWVILLRRATGEGISAASLGAVLVGFAGVALILRPGEQSGSATFIGLLTCVVAAVMWASGSFLSPRLRLPANGLASTGWQMLLGGGLVGVAGVLAGEAGDVHLSAFSLRSVVGLAYLIVFGSWLAFTCYAWLLQNAPISKVATYAYVNPVVAIVLGWLILGEVVTGVTVAGAAIIVASVAMVVRLESRRAP